jgi:colanic acid/amylovoran biosynthesis glycosyltransferase
MNQLTIAHFKDHFLPLSETFIYNLLSGFDRHRHIVIDRYRQENQARFPFQPHYSPAEAIGTRYATLERILLRLFGRSPYLERVLKQEQVDLIHAHFGQLGALIAPVARRHKRPLVVSFHAQSLSIFADKPDWRRRFDRLWQDATVCLALGPVMVKQLVEAGCPEGKIAVVPLPIDTSTFTYMERCFSPADDLNGLQLLTVARLVPKKGLDVLLAALARLPQGAKWQLRIVGDGPQRSSLEVLAAELNLQERVTFAGWLDSEAVAREMQAAQLFVLPSRTDPQTGETEGAPTVLLEAQATGLPVLSTHHADIAANVTDGQGGWLVPEGDVRALAQRLEQIIAQPELLEEQSRAARERIVQRHSKEAVAGYVQQLYEQCVRSS